MDTYEYPGRGGPPVALLHRIVADNKAVAPQKYPKLLLFYAKALSAGLMGSIERLAYRRKLTRYQPKYPPLFVLGHWRSGTSFLQSLIGSAPGYVHYNKFQTIFPDSFLLTRHSLKPFINYLFSRSPIARSWKDGLSHNFDSLDTASEIEVALINQMQRHSFHWGQVFPKSGTYYFDRYLFMDGISASEFRQWQRSVRHLNKKVNFTEPESRLVVKNPGDTARMRYLLELYPDAKFIFIHREPYDVFYSNIKLWQRILSNLSVQPVGEGQVRNNIRYIYRRVHENYLADRKLARPGQLAEIAYEDFRLDPVGTLGSVFEALQLPGFAENEPYYREYAGGKPFSPATYDYEPEEIRRLHSEWGPVMQQLGYDRSNRTSTLAGNSRKG